MRKIILVACDIHFGIGKDGKLPWQGKLRADMQRFKTITNGYPLIIGRKTYESFPKRPLPGRTNIVVTRQVGYAAAGGVVVNSFEAALAAAEQEGKEKVYILGGAEIYRQALPIADELDVTLIEHAFNVDTRFPPIDRDIWYEGPGELHEPDIENDYVYSFIRFVRRTTS